MMKLLRTPVSPFVRKCPVTIEMAAFLWHREGAVTGGLPRSDTLARIPALMPEDGERLTGSSLICEFLNHELGDYCLCPQSGGSVDTSCPKAATY